MYLCNHATGTIEDYVKAAIKYNFNAIGISDHAPFAVFKDRSVRMQESDYPIYLKQLDEAIKKYGDRIKIYKALEIEFLEGMDDHYQKLLKDLDYLTIGQHYIKIDEEYLSSYKIKTIEQMTIYKDTIVKAVETGYFKFVSHPDLFLFNTEEITDEILKISEEMILAAKKNDVALEINANGIRRGLKNFQGKKRYLYPREEFWELVKKHHAKVIINSDAHNPNQIFDQAILDAYEFSRTHEITVEEELVID